MWSAVPVMVSLSSFTAYTLLGGILTPAKAFTSLALFNILRFPMAVLPSVISNLVEALVSIDRVLKFLKSPEVDTNTLIKNELRATGYQPAVEAKSLDFFWDDERKKTALRDVSLKLLPGSLTLVIGKTGAGKSALLQALCGELKLSSRGTDNSKPVMCGSLSYAAQVPW